MMNLGKMECKFMCIYMFLHHVHNGIQLILFLFYITMNTENVVAIEKTITISRGCDNKSGSILFSFDCYEILGVSKIAILMVFAKIC